MKTLILAALFVLVPSLVCAEVVPCVKKLNGRWRIDRKEKCLQYTKKEGIQIADNKRLVRSLRMEVGNLKLQLNKKDFIIKEWSEVRYVSVKNQLDWMAKRLAATERQVVLWRTTANDLKKMKPPTASVWYKSPILWGFVGALIGTGITIGVVYATRPVYSIKATPIVTF